MNRYFDCLLIGLLMGLFLRRTPALAGRGLKGLYRIGGLAVSILVLGSELSRRSAVNAAGHAARLSAGQMALMAGVAVIGFGLSFGGLLGSRRA